jgi:hypothetical protein
MAKVKRSVTAVEYGTLAADIQKLYDKQDDGTYSIEVEGDEDTGALKRAKQHEVTLRKAAETAAAELKQKIADIEAELQTVRESGEGKKSAEVKATEKAWQAKLDKAQKELGDQLAITQAALKTQMVDSVAMRIATDIAGDNAEILLPHLRGRLASEIVDGKAVTKVIGADGAASASTVEELQKEFLSNPKFSAVVVGSRATGGGAGGRRGSGGAAQITSLKDFKTATEESKYANEHPAEYKALLAK